MTNNLTGRRKSPVVPVVLIAVFFFILGFITWLNGVLIPFLKSSCELNNTEALLVAWAFYISYFVMATPSSWLLKKTGFKKGMSLGLLIMALGTLTFLPAAYTRTYGLFLTALFIQGTGMTILQTAINPYITILGPIESAARRISIMGICNKVAGVIGPLILGTIALKDTDALKEKLKLIADSVVKNQMLDELALRVVVPYIIMAAVLVLLAFLVTYSPLPEIDHEEKSAPVAETESEKKNIFHFPYLILGFWAIFFYVGAEVIAGDTIILYGHSQGIPMEQARIFTSYTLLAMVTGYILGIILTPKIISQERWLAVSAVSGMIFSVIAIRTHGLASVIFIALLGLSNAIMWPAIWPLAIEGLGRFTKTGSAILIMGIAGGATLPLLYGWLADFPDIGHQLAYWLLIPCYAFILFYAVLGHKIGKKHSDVPYSP